jgi:hypothetical protein
MSDSYAPIVIFTYNRPEHTRALLQSLLNNRELSDSKIYIHSDGPKDESDGKKVQETINVVQDLIGHLDFDLSIQHENVGLFYSLYNGVSELFKKHKNLIVLEDDLIVHRHFLGYMNYTLDLYSNNQNLAQISGYTLPHMHNQTDLTSTPITTTWGWATWQHVWLDFVAFMEKSDFELSTSFQQWRFNLFGAYDYVRLIQRDKQGRLTSWGVYFYLYAFKNKLRTVYPKKSLVYNNGFDENATNTTKGDNFIVQIEHNWGEDLSSKSEWNWFDFIRFCQRMKHT